MKQCPNHNVNTGHNHDLFYSKQLHNQSHVYNAFSASEVPLPKVLIPVLALLAFIGLIVTSLLLSKNWGK